MVEAEFSQRVRRALLDRRNPRGHWEGHLSSSALSTATAVTAFAVTPSASVHHVRAQRHVHYGIAWLLAAQNQDGGWGDTRDSVSNISTTALVWAALTFGNRDATAKAIAHAEHWLSHAAGGSGPALLAAALSRRYGKDRTFSVPILTMCAIAGRLGPDGWKLIPQLPFELAVLPRRLFKWLRFPVVSYALPALISMGLARHRRAPGFGPLAALRARAAPSALRVLTGLQPDSGGFLEAVPLTAFVAMSLVAAGEPNHPAVSKGLAFLDALARTDGSWPIDSNLATWVTTLAVSALASEDAMALSDDERTVLRDWLLDQQWTRDHPYTDADPGGWAWTDLPGGVPDADDTAGALVALRQLSADDARTRRAAVAGVRWLLDLQNRDGGIPTFCRGWGALPFDRSATDLTAHALHAWTAWRNDLPRSLRTRVDAATAAALNYLARAQRPDGAFVPLWFGNQLAPAEENPTFGTARVLSALTAMGGSPKPELAGAIRARATTWLLAAQHETGGWGAAPAVMPTIEETALAVEALTAAGRNDPTIVRAVESGVAWLQAATLSGRQFPAAPLGLYFARLWYSEELYPIVFSAAACGSANAS